MIKVQDIKKHKIKIITVILYVATLVYKQDIFFTSVKTTGGYLTEMIQILPAVFIISGLITVWVPKEIIVKNFGSNSKIKGKFMSILIGSISAGPIYAAFPVTFSLLKKGASISNVVIMISSWAVIKVPMLIVESKFLGFDFMLIRTLLTIPAILAIGYIVKKVVTTKDVLGKNHNFDNTKDMILEIENILPQYNCGSCGFKNCNEYAHAVVESGIGHDKCPIGGAELEIKINNTLNQKQGGSNNGNN